MQKYNLFTPTSHVAVTAEAGMLTARFGDIEPFAVAPWVGEELPDSLPPLIRYLRGDFDTICGAGPEEGYMPHGEPANGTWRLITRKTAGNVAFMHLHMHTTKPEGAVTKTVVLADEPVVYTQTRYVMDARIPYGHHAIVRIPEGHSAADVSTSDFVFGMTYPERFDGDGGTPRLAVGQEVMLAGQTIELPLSDGAYVPVDQYYHRKGHDDLFMLSHDPNADFAWTAMTNRKEGYVFFTLKDPGTLASTLFWLSHYGRNQSPWGVDGQPRHGFVMGIEDVTAFFCMGVEASLGRNPRHRRLYERLQELGVKTSAAFSASVPRPINYIMGAVPVADGFTGVKAITADGASITIIDKGDTEPTRVPVCTSWLKDGNLDDIIGGN